MKKKERRIRRHTVVHWRKYLKHIVHIVTWIGDMLRHKVTHYSRWLHVVASLSHIVTQCYTLLSNIAHIEEAVSSGRRWPRVDPGLKYWVLRTGGTFQQMIRCLSFFAIIIVIAIVVVIFILTVIVTIVVMLIIFSLSIIGCRGQGTLSIKWPDVFPYTTSSLPSSSKLRWWWWWYHC